MKLRKLLLSALLSLLGLAWPQSARAQFLGEVSFQTVQQTLGTAVVCTGSNQIFAVQNLGQTQHQVSASSISGTVTSFQMLIQGVDKSGNTIQISDVAAYSSNTAVPVILNGSGYYPIVQVQVLCLGSGTFTLNYSGTSVTPQAPVGNVLTTAVEKQFFFGAADGSSFSVQGFIPPFGSTLGEVIFRFVGATGPAGSTVSVTCPNNAFQQTFPLVQNISIQTFQIPNFPCGSINLSYGSGGASAGTFSLIYAFNPPGFTASTDPCASSGIAKKSTAVAAAAAATSTLIASTTIGQSIYVCGYQFTQSTGGTSFQLVTGSGTNCGTGTASLTGVMQTIVGQPYTYGGADSSIFAPIQVSTGSTTVCLVAAGAGGTVNGVLTYVME